MNPVGEFQAFSPTHAITLLVCIVITTTCLLLGRRAINAGDDRTVARTLGVFGIFVNAWSLIFWLSPDRLDISKSIPMELCDMACIVAAISMLSHQRIFATLTVFWGFGLTTQAFITPIVTEPFADLKRTIGLTVIWVACMFVFNIIFNANYGFVGNTETARPTIVSLLGPWPLRAFLLCTIVTVWLWILWLLLRRRTS